MTGQRTTDEDAPPPCECCKYSMACTYPDGCIPFREYINTGKAISPPEQYPGEKNSEQALL